MGRVKKKKRKRAPGAGRPREYEWDEMFSKENYKRGGFTLTSGVDFECTERTMARLLRVRADEYGWRCHVNRDKKSHTVSIEVY